MPPILLLHAVQASLGDNFFVELFRKDGKGKRFWMVDGGPGTWAMAESYKKAANCLFGTINDADLGINKLERLIVTHNDFDHTYGAYALLSTLDDHEKATEQVKIDGQTINAPKISWVSWQKGYESMNPAMGTGQWPVGQIWFNDKANILIAKKENPSYGWMDTLIDGGKSGKECFRKDDFEELMIPFVNQDAGPEKLVGSKTSTKFDFDDIESILAPPDDLLKGVVKNLNTKPRKWKGTAAQFRANEKKGNVFPDSKGWKEMEKEKAGRDNSPTNKSSIAFTVTQDGRRILMTGDTEGWILDNATGKKDSLQKWDIIKVLHHGSSNNSVLEGTSLQACVAAFYTKFQADKYVVSSDTWNNNPNPDLFALRGMADAFYAGRRNRRNVNIYLTNGCSFQGWQALLFDVKQVNGQDVQTPRSGNMPVKIYVLKKANVCNYGTVVPSTDAGTQQQYETNHWLHLAADNQFAAYFETRIRWYFKGKEFMKQVPVTQPVTSILPLLINLNANPTPRDRDISTIGKGTEKVMESAFRKSSRKDMPTVRYVPYDFRSSGKFARHVVQGKAVTPTPPPRTPLTWHDMMVANLMSVPDVTAEDLEDMLAVPIPLPAAQVAIDGSTASWVDLPTFLSFVQSCNSQVVPTATTPRLSANYLATLSYWFLSAGDPTKEQTPILAWMLLTLLFGPDPATDLLTAFPLNANGPSSATLNPFMANGKTVAHLDGSLGMWSMVVQNFRALIVVPTGAPLEVQSFYFELGPPPPTLNSISSTDFMTWTVPFANSGWTTGQVNIAHSGNLRVKMKWPLYLDALTFCHFDGTLTVSRGPPVTFPVHGTMYLQRGAGASYDIQLKGDPKNNNSISALQVLSALSPTADMAATILTNIAAKIKIPPKMDLSQVIHQDTVLKDAGIILRQHNARFTAVSVDDLYGTVSVNQVLQFAEDLLPFPTNLNIPSNLPDFTLIICNATGDSEKVSIAFSQVVAGIGTVALEVGPADDGQTKFDIWTVCEDGVTVSDILRKLEQEARLPDFQSASILATSLLDDLAVPYTHITIGPADRSASQGKYTLQNLTLVMDVVDDIPFPSNSPLITLSKLTLQIMYTFAESTAKGATGSLIMTGNADVQLGNFDAICTFTYNRDADVIEADLDEGDDTDNPTAAANLAEQQSSTGGTFQGYIDFSFRFQSQSPSIGDIVSAFLLEPLDQVSSLAINIPAELRVVLDSVDFQALDMRVQKDATTQNKWEIVFLHLQVRLPGLTKLLSLLQPLITFDTPFVDIQIHYPSDSTKKAYEVSLGSWFICGGGRCHINLIFDSPPAGFTTNLETLAVSLTADVGHPGLPIGAIIEQFLSLTLSALNINASVPAPVADVLDTVTIDEAMITFVKISDSWKMKFVEVMVTSQSGPITFFDFKVSNAQLHLSRNSGVDTGQPPDTTVSFNTDLLVGTDLNISAGFTYDTVAGYTVAFKAGQAINLLDVITKGVADLGFDISSVTDRISKILTINVESFYFAYSHTTDTESISFSNDTGTDPNDAVKLFDLAISNISVYATKDGTWSYSVALALASPSNPFATFCGFPLLEGLEILNGKFALIKGKADTKVVGQAEKPKNLDPLSVTLCGTIVLGGSDFLNLIHSIIQVDQVDICIIGSKEVSFSIPQASLGLQLFNVFKVNSFSLDFQPAGFGLGANVDIIADWLPKPKGDITFSLIIMDDGGFGASFTIPEIDQPFGLKGLKITGIAFSLVWLAEAEEPQSMSASAGMSLIDPKGEEIGASFDVSFDEIGSDNWYKMDAHNMLLKTMIEAMTNGSLPPPLNSTSVELSIGFKLLHVDLEPKVTKFEFNADFFFMALEGQVEAKIDTSSGVTFAATMTPVNILGMVSINAYHGIGKGPFVYLDTTITDIISGKSGPPAGVTNINDPQLKGTVFALSATLDFLGATLDAFGLINDKGLQLSITEASNLSMPGVDFTLHDQFNIIISSSKLTAGTQFTYTFSLNLSRFLFLGGVMGSYQGTSVTFTDELALTVNYSGSDWHNDGLQFTVGVSVEVIDVSVSGTLNLDASYTNLSQLPGAIESYIEDQVYDWLKKEVLSFADPNADLARLKALGQALEGGFNIIGHDILNMLSEAGVGLEEMALTLKDAVGLGIDEVASGLISLGHAFGDISTAIASAFDAAPQELVSAFTAAGVAIEHAVDAAFGDLGADLAAGFGLVGSSIISVATDAVDAVESFVTQDVEQFADQAISDVGNFIEGAAEGFAHALGCEIM